MKTLKLFNVVILLSGIMMLSCNSNDNITIQGELKKWHRVSLVVDGPQTSELDNDNPFLNYRLDVTFSACE